jgi:signal transduction histidine kinase
MYRTRLVTIACLCLIFTLLLIRDAADAFRATPFLPAILHFSFSILVATSFLAMGALVWYYACNRQTALLLFGFSGTMSVTFAVESGAIAGDHLLSATASITSLVALACLDALLLVFPKSSISWPQATPQAVRAWRRWPWRVLGTRVYLCVQVVLCVVAIGATIPRLLGAAASWLLLVAYWYVFSGVVGGIGTIWLLYRRSPTLRERQQLRLLVSGIAIALIPFATLTILPVLLGFPPQLVVDSQISTIPFAVLPLALGYAALRYQLLSLVEASVRRGVASLLGLLSLVLLASLIIAISSVALPRGGPGQVGAIICALLVLGSLTWWGVRTATERLFFNEIRHYRKLLSRPERLARDSSDLAEAAWLVATAAGEAFGTVAACVFILDEESGCYRPYFPLNREDSRHLAQQLFGCVRPVAILGKQTDWLDGDDPALARLAAASRPLLLSELCRAEDAALPRWLSTTQGGGSAPLLAPLRVDDKMVGVLVLGARGDRQAYASPDFEGIDLIGQSVTPALETARLYALDSAHAALLLKLFTGLEQQRDDALKPLDEVAADYAKVIASAASAGAEPWLVEERDGMRLLRRLCHIGPGPTLALQEPVRVEELRARLRLSPTFFTWQRPADLVEALGSVEASASAAFSCAWLPLLRGEEFCGVLVLTYARPHAFSPKEQRLLALFANQCAAALENSRMLLDLEGARARAIQQHLGLDQFLLAALRDVRNPLATVGGYIEMAQVYSDRLSPDARAEFLAKAHRAADELVLLVSTIMDALQPTDMEQAPVSLLPEVLDMLVVLQGRLRDRAITIRTLVPPDLQVSADGMRLRQILLNLLDTAIAYASDGSALQVSAELAGREVTVYVRSFGRRVPQESQQRLFYPLSDGGAGADAADAPGRVPGLGLFVSKQQVERMGGHLWVEGSPAEDEPGSVFAFTLRPAWVGGGDQPVSHPSATQA